MARKIFFSGVAVCFFLAALFFYGLTRNYFQVLWWWDILMHILGGMWAGYIGAWFAVVSGRRAHVAYFIAGALILGGAVELVEFFSGFGRSPFLPYPIDTAKDLIDDAIGGAIAWYLIQRERA